MELHPGGEDSVIGRLHQRVPESLVKKRAGRPQNVPSLKKAKPSGEISKQRSVKVPECFTPMKQDNIFSNIRSWINSTDIETQFHGVKTARSLLCFCDNEELHTNVSELVNTGIIRNCVAFLTLNITKLVVETTWLISNISASDGTFTDYLISEGVIQAVIYLLESTDAEIVEHCMRTLGNCMGDNQERRLRVLSMNSLPSLIGVVKSYRDNMTNMSTLAFTLRCASKNEVPEEFLMHEQSLVEVEQILFGLQTLILINDTDIQSNVCWTIFNITTRGLFGVNAVLKAGLVPKLMLLLDSNGKDIVLPILKIMGNISMGDNNKVEHLVTYGIIKSLVPFLKSSNNCIMDEAMGILANVVEGTEDHARQVLESCAFEEILILLRSADSNINIKKDCLFILSTLASKVDKPTCCKLMEKIQKRDVMEILVGCLRNKDANVIDITLKLVDNILRLSRTSKETHYFLKKQFEEIGGVDDIDNLTYHINKTICITATFILDHYFPNGIPDCSEGDSSSSEGQLDPGDSDDSSYFRSERNSSMGLSL